MMPDRLPFAKNLLALAATVAILAGSLMACGGSSGGVFIETPTPTSTIALTATPTSTPTIKSTSTTLTTGTPTPTPTTAAATLKGTVLGGTHPISGATVTLYQAGESGYGSAGIELGTATSSSDGQFSLGFTPPSIPSVIYLVAAGGDAGAGNNAASVLVTVVPPSRKNVAALAIVIDELSTIGSVTALAQFIDPANPQSIGAPSRDTMGLEIGAATAAGNLFDPAAGTAPGPTLPSGASVPVAKLNTLANMLAACVVSSGPSSSACSGLFAAATPPGAGPPATTLAAALDIALNPANNVAGLFDLAAASTTYAPVLSAPPDDWTVAINYTGSALDEPTTAALDKNGNVWVSNYAPAVVELDPTGHTVSPAGGFTGGGLEESFAIAVDGADDLWVTNEQSPASVNSGLGTITKLQPDGTIVSGATGFFGGGLDFPLAVGIDLNGDVWTANFGNSSITKLDSKGDALSPPGGFTGGGLNFPVGVAIDASGNAWIANHSNNSVSEFASNGTPRSGSGGFTGGGLDLPAAIAIDAGGNVWVANSGGASVTELDSSGAPLSPAGGYGGGGLDTPGGIAIDGAGSVWVTNFHGDSLSAVAGASAAKPGTPLSPSTGFSDASLSEPYAPAIDSAGNVWTANFGNNSVTEFLGLAVPISTPLIGPPHRP
jgi:hypothetical protein